MTETVTRSSGSVDIHGNDRTVTDMKGDVPATDKGAPEKSLVSASYNMQMGDEDPTEEELYGPNALRRVSAPIPWAVYTVAFVELCERFSYYGTQVLCMSTAFPTLSMPDTNYHARLQLRQPLAPRDQRTARFEPLDWCRWSLCARRFWSSRKGCADCQRDQHFQHLLVLLRSLAERLHC